MTVNAIFLKQFNINCVQKFAILKLQWETITHFSRNGSIKAIWGKRHQQWRHDLLRAAQLKVRSGKEHLRSLVSRIATKLREEKCEKKVVSWKKENKFSKGKPRQWRWNLLTWQKHPSCCSCSAIPSEKISPSTCRSTLKCILATWIPSLLSSN